jgi:hypothetical protein
MSKLSELREALAKLCEKRAARRFEEFGYTESDTNASYYTGRYKELGDSLDEEDDDCAAAIRAFDLAPFEEKAGRETINRAAYLLDWLHDYCMAEKVNIDKLPYLPELQESAEQLRALTGADQNAATAAPIHCSEDSLLSGESSGAQSAAAPSQPEAGKKCGQCYECLKGKTVDSGPIKIAVTSTRMIVCETCGNKRCPHATDCALDCTDSNEPGQVGSVYAVAADSQRGENPVEVFRIRVDGNAYENMVSKTDYDALERRLQEAQRERDAAIDAARKEKP